MVGVGQPTLYWVKLLAWSASANRFKPGWLGSGRTKIRVENRVTRFNYTNGKNPKVFLTSSSRRKGRGLKGTLASQPGDAAASVSGDLSGASRPPFGSSRLPLLLSRLSFPKATSKGHENGLGVAAASHCHRRCCSGGCFGEPKPPSASASPSLSLPRSGFDPRQPRIAEKLSLWLSDFLASYLNDPPLDRGEPEICYSCRGELRTHRRDSSSVAPIAGDIKTDVE